MPRYSPYSPTAVGGNTAQAVQQASVNAPGSRYMEGLQAGTAAAAPFVETQVKAQQVVNELSEKEMGLAFRELLNKGLEGAQAYVQDMMKVDAEIGNKAQQQLQTIAPLFADPKLEGGTAQRALEAFYQSIDNQWKLKNEPDYFQKLEADKNAKIEINRAKQRDKPQTPTQNKYARKEKALPGLRNRLADWESKEPKIADIPEVADEMKSIQDELTEAENKYEELIEKEGGGFFRKRKLEKVEAQIKDLQERLADPEGVLVPNLREDPKEQSALEKKILDKYNKKRQEWSRERDRLSSKITALEAETGIVEEPTAQTVAPVKQGATAVKQPTQKKKVKMQAKDKKGNVVTVLVDPDNPEDKSQWQILN